MEKHVVVIDDEKAIHRILESRLSLCGFTVHCCATGKEGLKYVMNLIKTTTIEVILLDWMMPKMSGLEVLVKLKRHRKTRDIPVFMLTSKSSVDDLDKAYDLGADNFVIKPFMGKSIGKTIELKLIRIQEKKEQLLGVS